MANMNSTERIQDEKFSEKKDAKLVIGEFLAPFSAAISGDADVFYEGSIYDVRLPESLVENLILRVKADGICKTRIEFEDFFDGLLQDAAACTLIEHVLGQSKYQNLAINKLKGLQVSPDVQEGLLDALLPELSRATYWNTGKAPVLKSAFEAVHGGQVKIEFYDTAQYGRNTEATKEVTTVIRFEEETQKQPLTFEICGKEKFVASFATLASVATMIVTPPAKQQEVRTVSPSIAAQTETTLHDKTDVAKIVVEGKASEIEGIIQPKAGTPTDIAVSNLHTLTSVLKDNLIKDNNPDPDELVAPKADVEAFTEFYNTSQDELLVSEKPNLTSSEFGLAMANAEAAKVIIDTMTDGKNSKLPSVLAGTLISPSDVRVRNLQEADLKLLDGAPLSAANKAIAATMLALTVRRVHPQDADFDLEVDRARMLAGLPIEQSGETDQPPKDEAPESPTSDDQKPNTPPNVHNPNQEQPPNAIDSKPVTPNTISGLEDYEGSPLSKEALEKIKVFEPIYKKAVTDAGQPESLWIVIATLHYRETSLGLINPKNGQGLFQFVAKAGEFKPGKVSMEEFQKQASFAAEQFFTIYAKRGDVETPFMTDAGLINIQKIADTFFSYNGRAGKYKDQAKAMGYIRSIDAFMGSPYVVNLIDDLHDSSKNPNWEQYLSDRSNVGSANKIPGALNALVQLSRVYNLALQEYQPELKQPPGKPALPEKAASIAEVVNLGTIDLYFKGKIVRGEVCAIRGFRSSSMESNPTSNYYVKGADGNIIVNCEIAPNVARMFNDAAKDGIILKASSSFRTMKHQEDLWKNNPDESEVARPGRSFHQSGYAIDISLEGRSLIAKTFKTEHDGRPSAENPRICPDSPTWNWLVANASKYGLVQYFNEPWHWQKA